MRLSLPSRSHLAFAAPSTTTYNLPKPTLPRFSRTNPSFLKMDSHPRVCSVSCPSSAANNRSPLVGSVGRIGEVKRVTRETNVSVKINLDGTGIADSTTGIPFLHHMLDQLASHGLFDVYVRATGDLHIDDHHTNEDVALAIGTAVLQALGDGKEIHRFDDFSAPLEEAMIHVALDLSGRPHLSFDLQLPTQRVGTYDTQLAGTHTTSSRQLLKPLQGLFDRQQNMTCGAKDLFLVPKECCPALNEAALFTRHKPSNIIFKLLEFIPGGKSCSCLRSCAPSGRA